MSVRVTASWGTRRRRYRRSSRASGPGSARWSIWARTPRSIAEGETAAASASHSIRGRTLRGPRALRRRSAGPVESKEKLEGEPLTGGVGLDELPKLANHLAVVSISQLRLDEILPD